VTHQTNASHLRDNQAGFTLIELMIVVAIIGILASIGIPFYQNSAAKARQAEAISLMSGIYTHQLTYKAETGTFGASENEIGLDVQGARLYNAAVFTNVTASTFTATLTANLDNDPIIDTWQLTDKSPRSTITCSDITNIGPAC